MTLDKVVIDQLKKDKVALEDRIYLLETQLHDLRHTLADTTLLFPLEWHLSQSECRILQALLRGHVVTKEMLLAALYWDRGAEAPEAKILDVFICKVRKKLQPFGIKVATVWGRGWMLEREDLNKIHPYVQERVAA